MRRHVCGGMARQGKGGRQFVLLTGWAVVIELEAHLENGAAHTGVSIAPGHDTVSVAAHVSRYIQRAAAVDRRGVHDDGLVVVDRVGPEADLHVPGGVC